jgi:hypothetical protein
MKEGELWEWALVPRGMNQNANITKYNEVAKGMEADDRLAKIERDVRDIKKRGDHEEQMRNCVTSVKEEHGYSDERAGNVCASQLFNKADPDTLGQILKYDKKLQSNGRQMLAADMVKSCEYCKSEYVTMLNTMGPNEALGEMQKQLDLLRDNMSTDTIKQEEEVPAGAVGEEEMDPLQAIMERLDMIESEMAQIKAQHDELMGGAPAVEAPIEEEEVFASETGAPIQKEEPVETEPTPPSQTEQEEKELNEGVTTDTVKAMVRKELKKSLGELGYVEAPKKPSVSTKPPLENMHQQTEQVGQQQPNVPIGNDNWRDINKMDYEQVDAMAKRVIRGEQ